MFVCACQQLYYTHVPSFPVHSFQVYSCSCCSIITGLLTWAALLQTSPGLQHALSGGTCILCQFSNFVSEFSEFPLACFVSLGTASCFGLRCKTPGWLHRADKANTYTLTSGTAVAAAAWAHSIYLLLPADSPPSWLGHTPAASKCNPFKNMQTNPGMPLGALLKLNHAGTLHACVLSAKQGFALMTNTSTTHTSLRTVVTWKRVCVHERRGT